MVIKGKVLRLKLPDEVTLSLLVGPFISGSLKLGFAKVEVHASKCQRVKTTGRLRIEMPKVDKRDLLRAQRAKDQRTGPAALAKREIAKETSTHNGRVRKLNKETKLGDEVSRSG